jgi:hypothetical protein
LAAANLKQQTPAQTYSIQAAFNSLIFAAVPQNRPEYPTSRLHVIMAAALMRTFYKDQLLEEVAKLYKAQVSLKSHPVNSGGSRRKGSR